MRFCSLVSGSSGNAQYLEYNGTALLFDCGLSGKTILSLMEARGLEPEKLKAIFVTHEHSDHTKGVGILARRFNIPVFATKGTWSGMMKALAPLPPVQCREIVYDKGYLLGGMRISAIPLFHDAQDACGYSVEAGGKKVVMVTDTGKLNKRIMEVLRGADLTLLESNHDVHMLMTGPYPEILKRRIHSTMGHLSNEDCGNAISELLPEKPDAIFLLGHLSAENNTPELAYDTVCGIVRDRTGLPTDGIRMTYRDNATEVFEL